MYRFSVAKVHIIFVTYKFLTIFSHLLYFVYILFVTLIFGGIGIGGGFIHTLYMATNSAACACGILCLGGFRTLQDARRRPWRLHRQPWRRFPVFRFSYIGTAAVSASETKNGGGGFLWQPIRKTGRKQARRKQAAKLFRIYLNKEIQIYIYIWPKTGI